MLSVSTRRCQTAIISAWLVGVQTRIISDLVAAEYRSPNGTLNLLVEFPQSMANRLEGASLVAHDLWSNFAQLRQLLHQYVYAIGRRLKRELSGTAA